MSQRSARHFHRTLVSVAVAALLIGSGIASARDKPASKDSVLATDAHGYLGKV
ncbi:UNVERIFIED_ORG: acid phosphatase (class A) [Xanthomonas axonopodis]